MWTTERPLRATVSWPRRGCSAQMCLVNRLIKEIRLGPDKLQAWLRHIVTDFNRLIDLYAEPEYKKIWKVSVADMSVAFGASKDRWGFNIETARAAGMSFKDIYDAYMGEGPEKLSKKLLLNETLLSMVIHHHPSPKAAQSSRIPQLRH